MKGKEKGYAHCIIDQWVNLTFTGGLLFPRLDYDGTVKLGKFWKANNLSDSLERDLKRYNLYEDETPHSFRHGGVVDRLRKDNFLELTMYTAYMKDKSTAWNYAKGLRHFFPKNFDWKDAGVDVEGNEDLKDLATQMLSWKAFSSDNVPL